MATSKTKPVPKPVAKQVTATITRTKPGEAPKVYTYNVESGITIMGRRREFNNHFPFDMMKVGDSFLIPTSDPLSRNPNGVHYACKQFAKEVKTGFMVTTRKLLDGTRRVWRIK
jgi:hypothetical protein